jgi:hypothetical protein
MIKVSVFYPNNEGSRFDIGYYCNSLWSGVRLCAVLCASALPLSSSANTRLDRRDQSG